MGPRAPLPAHNHGRPAIAPAPGNPGAEPPAAAAYLISPEEVSPGWVMLYAGTFVLQAFCASARAFVTYPLLWVAFTILHLSKSPLHDLVLLIAYGPLGLSLATLVLPLGGWCWQQRSGARAPSEREQMIYDEAIKELTTHDPTQRPPRRWCVIDEPTTNAAVYADTLMVTRGLLESAYLTPVIAHELGHLNSSDARLTAALTRLSTPPRRQLRNRLMRAIAFIATGAAAVWATRLPWAAYWREREYEADTYAAQLGQAQPLAMFLDTEALDTDLPSRSPGCMTTATRRQSTGSTASSTSEQPEGQANERTGNNPNTPHPLQTHTTKHKWRSHHRAATTRTRNPPHHRPQRHRAGHTPADQALRTATRCQGHR